MQGKLWTISNVLSLSRILLMAPVVYFFLTPMYHNREYAVFFTLLAVITDALDGYIARILNQESEIGKLIDPMADKIGVGIVVVLLVYFGDIPLWFAILIILRDALIFCGGIIVKLRKGVLLASNMPGKIAVSIVALTLVMAMVHHRIFLWLTQLSMWASVGLLLLSFVLYSKRFYMVMKTTPENIDPFHENRVR